MIFEVKKDQLYTILFYVLFLIFGLLMVTILQAKSTGHTLSFLVSLSIIILLVWIWYATDYKISNLVLAIRFGPFKRNIPISSISKVELNKTVWVSNNLGLAKGGMIIHYCKTKVVYITPQNVSRFCEELKLVNKNILFTKK